MASEICSILSIVISVHFTIIGHMSENLLQLASSVFKSLTEISSSLFKSGSSSLKTERKSTLVATYGHDADVGLFPSGAGLFEKQGAKNK